VFRAVDRVIEAGLEPRRFVQDLLERFRDLLVLDAVPDAADNGLLDAPADQLERMRSQAERYGRPSLSRAADVMATALVDMRGTTSPRLVLELACARVLLPGAASDTSALLARLDRLEARLSATGVAPAPAELDQPAAMTASAAAEHVVTAEPAAPIPPPPTPPTERSTPLATPAAEPAAPAPPVAETEPARAVEPVPAVPAPATPAGTLDLAGLRRLWDSVLDAVKQRSRTAHALMLSSQIESFEDATLTLSFKTPTLATRFANDVADFVVEALKEVVGLDLTLRAISGPAPTSSPAATVRSAAPASSDPEPEEIDVTDPDSDAPAASPDPAVDALALLQDGLGAQIIGEIDRT
jgi:DNA polymerase III subunit gamma/tau